MEYIVEYWFASIPAGLGLGWFAAIPIVGWIQRMTWQPPIRTVGRLHDSSSCASADPEREPRWLKAFSLALICFHFPVIVVATVVTRRNEGPPFWLLIPMQAVAYTALLWGVSRLAN